MLRPGPREVADRVVGIITVSAVAGDHGRLHLAVSSGLIGEHAHVGGAVDVA
jgi:hypothetical protein